MRKGEIINCLGHTGCTGTSLSRPPLGNDILAIVEGWPYLRDGFVLYQHSIGTQPSVLYTAVASHQGWPL